MNCSICNKKIDAEPLAPSLPVPVICYTCRFWQMIVEDAASDRQVRIEGECFFIGLENSCVPAQYRGFGGKKFKIRKLTGALIETESLWYNGRVPEHFKTKLPDNAKWELTMATKNSIEEKESTHEKI